MKLKKPNAIVNFTTNDSKELFFRYFPDNLANLIIDFIIDKINISNPNINITFIKNGFNIIYFDELSKLYRINLTIKDKEYNNKTVLAFKKNKLLEKYIIVNKTFILIIYNTSTDRYAKKYKVDYENSEIIFNYFLKDRTNIILTISCYENIYKEKFILKSNHTILDDCININMSNAIAKLSTHFSEFKLKNLNFTMTKV